MGYDFSRCAPCGRLSQRFVPAFVLNEAKVPANENHLQHDLVVVLFGFQVGAFYLMIRLFSSLLAACLVALPRIAAAANLQVTDLGPAENASVGLMNQLITINDLGQVAGVLNDSGNPLPFVWQNGVMSYLPNLPGATFVYTTAISDSGQVVGYSNAADGKNHAVTWQNGAISMLPTIDGQNSMAFGVNDSGQIVGAIGDYSNTWRPVLWDGNSIIDLGAAAGTVAYDINNSGVVTGGTPLNTYSSRRAMDGFIWQNSTLTDLGSQGVVAGIAINDQGTMAGDNFIIVPGSYTFHAVVYQDGVLTDIGKSPDGPAGIATGINDLGQVIGVGDFNGAYPFIWQDGQKTSLRSLSSQGSPWFVDTIWDINDHGQIVGLASNSDTRQTELVLLTIPEPPTCLLLLFGLPLLGMFAARRNGARGVAAADRKPSDVRGR